MYIYIYFSRRRHLGGHGDVEGGAPPLLQQRERILYSQPTGPNSLYHRDDLVDWPRARGVHACSAEAGSFCAAPEREYQNNKVTILWTR